jgi:hypothetical protein
LPTHVPFSGVIDDVLALQKSRWVGGFPAVGACIGRLTAALS